VFSLEQNFPNPFNPVTTVMFSLPEKGEVDLGVYDVSGRLVKTLYQGVMDQGKHKATWDGTNTAGRAVSSGVYFCKLFTKDNVAETKMVILK
jgi:flagellar hook assembly protein FlgD